MAMRLEDVCSLLVKLEQENDVNGLVVNGIRLWPLIRHCLWVELAGGAGRPAVLAGTGRGLGMQVIRSGFGFARWVKGLRAAGRADKPWPLETATLFLSRPAYLQKIPSGLSFDRIVDPLVFLARHRQGVAKAYLSPWPAGASLFFSASSLRVTANVRYPVAGGKIAAQLDELSSQAGLGSGILRNRFDKAWWNFSGWYETGKRLFRTAPGLKRVFLTSWYFPDTMGLIAAARECGIETIDVQHGKQGRYQGMYSWWTDVPVDGYQMLPNRFWCWGQPSCDHILASSPERRTHRPFVGGFPWLDYYREFIAEPGRNGKRDSAGAGAGCRVLVTLQGRAGVHSEQIPNFLVEYLSSGSDREAFFTFRCHPNDRQCVEYCRVRLGGIPSQRFIIDDGTSNLYDRLLQSTHHITAFSSCCYEADALGVPSLLFGTDALAIYEEEIRSRMFAWTDGTVADLDRWMCHPSTTTEGPQTRLDPYIVSSFRVAAEALG
jgi:hypothetical protein